MYDYSRLGIFFGFLIYGIITLSNKFIIKYDQYTLGVSYLFLRIIKT